MKNILVAILVLLVAVGAVGYWREWYSVTNEGQIEVQVDSEKVQEDKEAFSKAVGEKTQAMKDQVARLWEESEGLTGDDKVHAQTEIGELKKKQDRLERQIEELEDASKDKFESIKQDLSKALEEVEKEIEELKEKMGRGKDK